MLTKRITGLKQMLILCFVSICAALTASSAFAQDRNVTGIILDETDTGIAGAYVVVKGETRGAMTDDQGRFNISVSPSDVLVASFLGYMDEEVTVGEQTNLTIKLIPQANELEEVVKVAYGTQRKASVIGSISTVDMGTLAQSQGNLSTSLAGKLAGVVAIQKTGEPGASADFWIRGVSTFGANSTPLILVDGVERSMDMVDTEDIASLSILKDASATALYGVRGANGIVLITTKRGAESKPQLTVKVETGMTSPVSSSTKSSIHVLSTFAASFLPSFALRFSAVASISSASPKMSMISLSPLNPMALRRVVTGNFFLRSMYAYMTLLMSVANSIHEPLNGMIRAE